MPNETDFLDDIVGANAPVQEPTEDVAEPVEEPETPEPQEPAKEEVETGEKKTEATPATDKSKEEQGTLAGLKAEREKRQEAQRRSEELERQLAELRQQKEQQQRPEFFDDPTAYVKSEVHNATQRIQQQFYAAMEADAREQHADYDDVIKILTAKAQDNPALIQKVFQSANPAREAYRLGRQIQQMEQMQDPEAYRTQIEAELRAKWEAELQAKTEAKRKAAEDIPPDLTQARNARGEFQPKAGELFKEIFRDKK
ncbi:hypothetical protein [Xanthomonas albilineans]|uniref:hypothetical protein n=1 Tax=Xanthomonas albilineans TaxID=29447 RepID=UPI0005F32112|nr:hypothetical protein [Xanthomonas albilineans]